VSPAEREELFGPQEPAEPKVKHRRQPERRRLVSQPGGVTSPCGCIHTRTGGEWWHVTPCRSHELALYPFTDEVAQRVLAA
jgi:hypothetical protein